mmetsp:Transcript_11908/g.49889  ORF Transcript_11908/g.49889 Transcript_11908/m.49889 type:complete len:221 (-) Transcript_11908:340-1002(-)
MKLPGFHSHLPALCRHSSSTARSTRRHSPEAASSTPALTERRSRLCRPKSGPAPLLSATPALSFARWICAMDPDAMGLGSIHAKISLSCSAPYARSRISFVRRQECSGAPACNSSSSLHSFAGNTSYRVLAHCPHLMNAAPPSSSVLRSILYHSSAPPSPRKFEYSNTGANRSTGENKTERWIARSTVRARSTTDLRLAGNESTHVTCAALIGTSTGAFL